MEYFPDNFRMGGVNFYPSIGDLITEEIAEIDELSLFKSFPDTPF